MFTQASWEVVKKEPESWELNSHPLGTLFKFQSGCMQETNQSLVEVPLHGRCSGDALWCQHTPVHCLNAGCETCQQSLPPQPGIYYPEQFPNSSIAGLCVKHQSASVFTTFTKYHRPSVLPANLQQWCKAAFFYFFFNSLSEYKCLPSPIAACS